MPRQRFNRLPAEKQAKILEAGGKEFAAHGFDGASLNRVLKEAGISKGAAYYYFDDKADLYYAVVQHYWDHIVESATLEFNRLTADNFWSELGTMYQAMFSHCAEHPWILDLLKSVWKLSPEMRCDDQTKRLFELIQGWFLELVRKGREVGAMRADLPDDLTLMFLMAIDEAGGLWLANHWSELENPGEVALQLHLKMLNMVHKMLQPDSGDSH